MGEENKNDVRVSYHDLTMLLAKILVRFGVSEANATLVAANCAACERDGSISHGVFRIPGYVASLSSGWVDGKARPVVEDAGAAFVRVDARNGFAQPALAIATPIIVEKVVNFGAAVVAIRDSHHFSALWPDLEPFAKRGFVALSMVSGLACVSPPDGHAAILGTNPIAFATPVDGADPMIYDFATSSMSNGDLRIAAREGRSVPRGTGIDVTGAESSDPGAILNGGALLPFGGHKGAAISLMVEILASALTGGQFSSEVDFSTHPGAETPKTGQVLIVIDPQRGGNDAFARRVGHLIGMMRASGQTRLPSDRRYRMRNLSEREGIALDQQTYRNLLSMTQ